MNPFELYGEFSSTWERLRSDIIAHAVFVGILYLSGYGLPTVDRLGIDPKSILDNDWSKFLGAVGLPLTLAAVSAFILVIYTSLLRGIGRTASDMIQNLVGNRSPTPVSERERGSLLMVAASLPETQLSPQGIEDAFRNFVEEVNSSPPEKIAGWVEYIVKRRGDRLTIYQDSCFFLFAWIVLPIIGISPTNWLSDQGHPVICFLMLFAFVFVSRNYNSLGYSGFNIQYLQIFSSSISVCENRNLVRQRIREKYTQLASVVDLYLRNQRHFRRLPPSLWRYVQHRWPFARGIEIRRRGQRMIIRRRWRNLVNQGRGFEFARESANYDRQDWLTRYLKWRLLRVGQGVLRTANWFWTRLRF